MTTYLITCVKTRANVREIYKTIFGGALSAGSQIPQTRSRRRHEDFGTHIVVEH